MLDAKTDIDNHTITNKISIMKKTLISVSAAVLCIVAVSCGNRSGKNDNANGDIDSKAVKELAKEIEKSSKDGGIVGYTGDAGAALKTMDSDNFLPIVKGIFGVDVTPLDGWTVYQAKSPNKVNNASVIYKNAGPVDGDAVQKAFFDQVLACAEDGVNTLELDFNTFKISKGEAVASLEDYKAKALSQGKTIYYKYGGKGIQASCHARSTETASVIEYSFGLVSVN